MRMFHTATRGGAWATLVGGLLANTANAANFVVNTLTDENDGVGTGNVSLREAIDAANAAGGYDTITFSVTGTITLGSALPAITSNITIDGPGQANLTISGNNLYRPFFIDSGTVTIEDLTVANGRAAGGSGGDSQSSAGGGGAAGMGGAVFVAASANLIITRTAFAQNTAVGGAGGGFESFVLAGGGGGGVGGNGGDGASAAGGDGGAGGLMGGTGGSGSSNSSTPGGQGTPDGAGGGGGGLWNSFDGTPGGAGSFGGGGGGGGNAHDGGAGGFGGGGGGGGVRLSFSVPDGSPGLGGDHAGSGGNPDWNAGSSGSGGGGAGLGGAIFVRSGGSLIVAHSTFTTNSASGGAAGTALNSSANGSPGQGKGGAIYVQSGATVGLSGVVWGSGGNANSASDDVGSGTDTNDVYGAVVNFPSVVSFSLLSSNPTNAGTVQFGVQFSESVTGVNDADFDLVYDTATTPTIASVTGSGSSYTITVNTGASDGRIALQLIDDDSIVNGASVPLGNTGAGNGDYFDGAEYVIDRAAPTVSSAVATPTLGATTNASSIQIDISMSEEVTGFAAGDVTFTTGGTATVGSVTLSTVSATVLRATLSGLSGSGFLNVSLAEGAVADAAGNTNAVATILNTNLDSDSPTVTLLGPATATPTNADSVAFTVAFSESVSGFDSAADVTVNVTGSVTFGTPMIVAASGMPYSVTVPNIAGDGTISLSVNAAAATDVAGNTNQAGGPSSAITIDNTPPTVVSVTSPTPSVGGSTEASLVVTLSEPIVGFAIDDLVVLHSGTASTGLTITQTGATSYDVRVTGLSGSGSFAVQIATGAFADQAGNALVVGGSSLSILRNEPANGNTNANGGTNENDNTTSGSSNANTSSSGQANANAAGGGSNANSGGGSEDNTNGDSNPVEGADTDGDDAPPPGPCGAGVCGVAGFAPSGLMLCMIGLRSRTLRRAMLLDPR